MDRFVTRIVATTEPQAQPAQRTPTDSIEIEADEPASYSCGASKSVKKKGYNHSRKYKQIWEKKFSWLTKDDKSENPMCLACRKTINCAITHIERHGKSLGHINNVKKAEKTIRIENYYDGELEKNNNLLKSAELKLMMFLHEHNLPFLLMDHLPDLLKSVCPDSQVAKQLKCARTKSTYLTKHCIAKFQQEQIAKKLNECVYSLIVDETTDVGTEKSLAIVVRFFNEEVNDWKDQFLGLVKVHSSSAEDLFNAIHNCLVSDKRININNLIGFAADNAAVMMGNINGVQARFKQILPNIFVFGCICHSFHLCSSAAAKKLPASAEDLVRGVYNYFAHSSKRLERLKEFQMFVELKPHKMLRPSQTRWLSLQAAVDRVLENWSALILFFTHECFEEKLHSTQLILSSLQNRVTKLYFLFLSYVLEIINKLNLEFQSEKPKLHLLLGRIRDSYKSLLRNFIKISHLNSRLLKDVDVTNPENYLDLDNIYYGAKVEIAISQQNIEPNQLNDFRSRCLDFYIELTTQIKSRVNFDDPILEFMANFNPKIALSGNVGSIAAKAVQYFPCLVNDIEKLNSEWRLLADLTELKEYEDYSSEDFWLKIFSAKNSLKELMFPNLTKLVKGIFSLPHSSACAERVFSQLTLLKTKLRNRMNIDTCDSILHAKELLGKNVCYTWQPTPELIKYDQGYNRH